MALPISKMGRYMATIKPPMTTPRKAITAGSISAKAVDIVVDLFFVVGGGFVEHAVQSARLLANTGHLHHHGGKDLGGAHGVVHLLTFIAYLQHGIVDHVAHRTRHRVEGLDQGTGGKVVDSTWQNGRWRPW